MGKIRRHCCGFFQGFKVFQVGQMIGNNWYGHFYASKKRNGRYYKIEKSISKSLDEVVKKIKNHELEC